MPSIVGICNLALGRIGIDQFIESIDDPNNRARACKNLYENVRDQVLEDYPWNFAQAVAPLALAAGAATAPGFQFKYSVPSTCLRAQAVTDAGGSRFSGGGIGDPYQQGEIWNYGLASFTRAPFKVMIDSNNAPTNMIVTDLAEAYLWFTSSVQDPHRFSALFASSLAWKMAGELALTLKADTKLATNAGKVYMAEISRARLLSAEQSRRDGEPQSPSIAARG